MDTYIDFEAFFHIIISDKVLRITWIYQRTVKSYTSVPKFILFWALHRTRGNIWRIRSFRFRNLIDWENAVLDPRKLDDEEVESLANLFDKLKAKARGIGGATEKKQIEELKPIIHEIDREIGKILRLSDLDVYEIQNAMEQLIKRRAASSEKVKRHIIKGEEEIPELKKPIDEQKDKAQLTLDSFLEE